MLRITAGAYKGLCLKSPPTFITRPSSNKLRQAIFNMLTFTIEWSNATVCDAFAGSGALGIEALSRGASKAVFCEKSFKAARVLHHNLQLLGKNTLDNKVGLILDFFALKNDPFDIIFLDPPYDTSLPQQAIDYIVSYELLKKAGIVILEQSKNTSAPKTCLKVYKQRVYGQSQVLFLTHPDLIL